MIHPFRYDRLMVQLKDLCLSNVQTDPGAVRTYVKKLLRFLELRDSIRSKASEAEAVFGVFWEQENSDPNKLQEIWRWRDNLRSCCCFSQ